MTDQANPVRPGPDDRFTVGIDFGTLSGRAVVVRVSDGAELGSAVHEYPHARHGRPCSTASRCGDAVAAARLGAAGARRLRRRAADTPCPAAVPPPASTPSRSSGSAPTSPPARCCPCSPTGRPCASCPSTPTGRTPTSSSGSTTPRSRRPTGSTSWRTDAASRGSPRYGGLISSEWEFAKGLQLLEEDPEIYDRMDHFVEAADWIVWQLDRPVRPQRLHRRLQGHLPGRPIPRPRLPGSAEPGLRRLRRGQARSRDRRSWATPPARSAPRPRRGPACPRASPSPSATWTPT